jgi:hypothetical protein
MAQAATMGRPKGAQSKRAPARSGARSNGAKQPQPWSHGQFCWNELRTRDAERAKEFYAGTVGWTF